MKKIENFFKKSIYVIKDFFSLTIKSFTILFFVLFLYTLFTIYYLGIYIFIGLIIIILIIDNLSTKRLETINENGKKSKFIIYLLFYKEAIKDFLYEYILGLKKNLFKILDIVLYSSLIYFIIYFLYSNYKNILGFNFLSLNFELSLSFFNGLSLTVVVFIYSIIYLIISKFYWIKIILNKYGISIFISSLFFSLTYINTGISKPANFFEHIIIIFPFIMFIIIQIINTPKKDINSYWKLLKNLYEEKNIEIDEFYNEAIKRISEEKNKANTPLKLISDEPINDKSQEDILNREKYIDNIYGIIRGLLNNNDINYSYSIGINGKWGEGKTSIINLLEDKHLKFDKDIRVLRFNPWDYDKENLIQSFFNEFSFAVDNNIFNLFKKYLKVLGLIGSEGKILSKIFESFYNSKQSIEDIRSEINNYLGSINGKVVVIIDDLDRCEPSEVLTILNLVKNIGNLNNIIYILSYDKENILKDLKEKSIDERYLDKIINYEEYIYVAPGSVKKFFIKKFSFILKKNFGKDFSVNNILNYIEEHLQELFEKENLRIIKKLLNRLNVLLSIQDDEKLEIIKKFDSDDYLFLILINYYKLIDYNFFRKILNIYYDIKNKNGDNYPIYEKFDKNSLPIELLNFSKVKYGALENKFLGLIFNLEDVEHNNIVVYIPDLEYNKKFILNNLN